MRQPGFPFRSLMIVGLCGFGIAVIAAGCGGGGSSSSALPNTATAAPNSTCAAGGGGVAYVPTSAGLNVIPFETTTQLINPQCTSTVLDPGIALADLAVSAGGVGVALNSSGTQIYGFDGMIKGGVLYANAAPQTVASSQPLTSLALITGTYGFAVDADTSAAAGFIGLNNFLGFRPSPTPIPAMTTSATASPNPNASPTPQFTPVPNAGTVAYEAIGAPTPGPSTAPNQSTALGINGAQGRTSVAIGPDAQTILVRGYDLIAFQAIPTNAGYFYSYPAAGTTSPITTLNNGSSVGEIPGAGYASGIPAGGYGHGLMAFAPSSSSRALIGAPGGATNSVALVAGIPTSMTVTSNLTIPMASTSGAITVTSVAVSSDGNLAAVGTNHGIRMLTGISGSALTLVPATQAQIQPTYTLAGTSASATPGPANQATLNNVISVGFSADGRFVLALADDGTGTASLLVFPVDANGNLSIPTTVGPSMPKPSGDYLVVR